MAARKVRVTLYLSSEILREIDQRAAIARVSRSTSIEAVILEYLSNRERLVDARAD
jgi:metal-responsive CopG/Arc/MetJ family transcriptional regulator